MPSLISNFEQKKLDTMAPLPIIHYYRKSEPSHSLLPSLKEQLKSVGLADDAERILDVETESCFNILLQKAMDSTQKECLEWLLAETFEKDNLHLEKSALSDDGKILEFGPRMTFTSAFSSNATSICQACHLPVERCEQSRRYLFITQTELSNIAWDTIEKMLHDKMTEEIYTEPIISFDSGITPKPVKTVPIMEHGRSALEDINRQLGLGFDEFDLDYYTTLFKVRQQNGSIPGNNHS